MSIPQIATSQHRHKLIIVGGWGARLIYDDWQEFDFDRYHSVRGCEIKVNKIQLYRVSIIWTTYGGGGGGADEEGVEEPGGGMQWIK